MKKIISAIALVLALACTVTPASARNEIANNTPTVTENGITVINPIESYMEVIPVGLYGITKSETAGDVYLVMMVTNKNADKETALFGSSIENKKMIAADGKGKVFNIDASGAMRYDTPTDMPVRIIMSEEQMQFMNVPTSLTSMPMVKIGICLDPYHQGNLTFKNVPIYWDQTPEE